jgi:hypothetical protein
MKPQTPSTAVDGSRSPPTSQPAPGRATWTVMTRPPGVQTRIHKPDGNTANATLMNSSGSTRQSETRVTPARTEDARSATVCPTVAQSIAGPVTSMEINPRRFPEWLRESYQRTGRKRQCHSKTSGVPTIEKEIRHYAAGREACVHRVTSDSSDMDKETISGSHQCYLGAPMAECPVVHFSVSLPGEGDLVLDLERLLPQDEPETATS